MAVNAGSHLRQLQASRRLSRLDSLDFPGSNKRISLCRASIYARRDHWWRLFLYPKVSRHAGDIVACHATPRVRPKSLADPGTDIMSWLCHSFKASTATRTPIRTGSLRDWKSRDVYIIARAAHAKSIMLQFMSPQL